MIEWLRSKDSWRPFLSRISNQLKEIVGTQEAHRRGMMQLSHKTVVNLKKCRVPSKKCRPMKKRRLRLISDSESCDEQPHLIPKMARCNLEIDAEDIAIVSVLPKTEPLVVTLVDSDTERDIPMKIGKRVLRKRRFLELFGSDSDDETSSSALKEKFEQHDGKVVCLCTECIKDQCTEFTPCDSPLDTDEHLRKSETIIADKSEVVHPGGKPDCDENVINSLSPPVQRAPTNEEPVLKIKVTAAFPEVTLEIEESSVVSPTEEPDSSTLSRGASMASVTAVLVNSEKKVGKSVDKNDFVSSSGLPASPLDNSSVSSRTGLIRVRDYRSLGISDNWSANAGESASNSLPVTAASAKPVSRNTPFGSLHNAELCDQSAEFCIRFAQEVFHVLPEKCEVNLNEITGPLDHLFLDYISYWDKKCDEQRSSQSLFIERTKANLDEAVKNTRLLVKKLQNYLQEYINDNKSLMIVLCGRLLKKFGNERLRLVMKFISLLFQEPLLAQCIKSAANDSCHLTISNSREGTRNSSWHTISDSMSVESSSSVDSTAVSFQNTNAPRVPHRPNMIVSEQQVNEHPQPTAVYSNSSQQHPVAIPSTEVTTPLYCSPSHTMGQSYPENQGIHPGTQLVQSVSETNVDKYPFQPLDIRETVDHSGTADVRRSVQGVMNTQSVGSTKGGCEQPRMPNLPPGSYVSTRLHQNINLPIPSKPQQESENSVRQSANVSPQLHSHISLPHHTQQPNRTATGYPGVTAVASYHQQKGPAQALNNTSQFLETQSHHTPCRTMQHVTYKPNELAPNQQSQSQQITFQTPAIQQVSYQQPQALYQSTQVHKVYSSNSQHDLSQAKSQYLPQQLDANSFTQSQGAHPRQGQYTQTQVPYQQTLLLSQRTQTQLPCSGNQHDAFNQQFQIQQPKLFCNSVFPSATRDQPKMFPTKTPEYHSGVVEVAMQGSPVNQLRNQERIRHGPQATSAGFRVDTVQPIVSTVNQSCVSEAQRYVLARPPPPYPYFAHAEPFNASQICTTQDRAIPFSAVTSVASPIHPFQSPVGPAQSQRTRGAVKVPTKSYRAQAPAHFHQIKAPQVQSRPSPDANQTQCSIQLRSSPAHITQPRISQEAQFQGAHGRFDHTHQTKGFADNAPQSQGLTDQTRRAQGRRDQNHRAQGPADHALSAQGVPYPGQVAQGLRVHTRQTRGPSVQPHRAPGLSVEAHTQGRPDPSFCTQNPQHFPRHTSLPIQPLSLSQQTQEPSSAGFRAQNPLVNSFETLTDPTFIVPSQTFTTQQILAVTQPDQSLIGGNQTLQKQPVQSKGQLVQRQSTLDALLRSPTVNEKERNDEQNCERANISNSGAKPSERNMSLDTRFSSNVLAVGSHRIIPGNYENLKKDQCHPGQKDYHDGSSISSRTHSSESTFHSVPSSECSEITLPSVLNKSAVSTSVEQSSKTIQTMNTQISVIASSEQPSFINCKLSDFSVSPEQMLCSKKISQSPVEKTSVSSKTEGLQSPHSSLVGVQLLQSPEKVLQFLKKSQSQIQTKISVSEEIISNGSKTSGTLVQTSEESSKTPKICLSVTDTRMSPSEDAISKRQVSGFLVPSSSELDEMSEQKRLKAEKCWVSLNEVNNQLMEEINKVKLMLESCGDCGSSPKRSVVVSNDSQEHLNVCSSNIDDRRNIVSDNGKAENNDEEQEPDLRGQQDDTLKENDLSVLEATVLQELVLNADDSIVNSVKRELHSINAVPCESSTPNNDCCIISENIIDVKEESKDLRLAEPKNDVPVQENVIVGSDLNMVSRSNDVKLPVIQAISPHVGRARSTSLDSGYTTPSPHLQVDSIQHHDNFQVGSVGEREYICANCPKEAKIYCTACSGTLYCSTECQTMHWYMTHNMECDGVPEKNRGAMV